VINAKVDADHASGTVTRRSRTGFIVYLNCAPVYWLSKEQTKQCYEYLRGLRYTLRMMGIPCEGPAYIHGDNQFVLASCGIPDSILKKESQSGLTRVLPACVEAKGFCQTTTAPYLPNHECSEALLQYVCMCGLGMEVVHVRTASWG
jgi:hypothetical protein